MTIPIVNVPLGVSLNQRHLVLLHTFKLPLSLLFEMWVISRVLMTMAKLPSQTIVLLELVPSLVQGTKYRSTNHLLLRRGRLWDLFTDVSVHISIKKGSHNTPCQDELWQSPSCTQS